MSACVAIKIPGEDSAALTKGHLGTGNPLNGNGNLQEFKECDSPPIICLRSCSK